jgi:hypothetical protein
VDAQSLSLVQLVPQLSLPPGHTFGAHDGLPALPFDSCVHVPGMAVHESH